MDLILVFGGVVALYAGGEALVRGAVRLAGVLGVRPLIIGLTVVAFGTSSPELAASVTAALTGAHEVVLGNVVGSNIMNIGLVLGLTALVYPLSARLTVVRREVPVMVAVGLLPLLVARDGVIGRLEGLILVLLLAVYLLLLYRESRMPEEAAEFVEEYAPGGRGVLFALAAVAAGAVLLVVGARWLVEGGVNLARTVGVSERVIGLTLVAFGTSLPELASAMVAAVKQEADIVLGNLIGSSIFNILAILGLTSMVRPVLTEYAVVVPDILVMTAFGLLALPMLHTRKRLDRWEGGVLAAGYLLYLVWLLG
ncbi:MAG: calcium/sodium antiporter [bacterium]